MKNLLKYLPTFLAIVRRANALKRIGVNSFDTYKYIPPRPMRFVGGGNYLIVGHDFFNLFKELLEISPDAKILDVGCGTGRIAVPFIKFLSPEGEYHGFDIVKSGIDWCTEKISGTHPNFQFSHADIFNKAYNPSGKIAPADFRFPYEDEQFDLVILTSVFTHMHSKDVEHYLAEICRVLKPGGKCFITYFLINDESTELIKAGLASQNINIKINEDLFTKNPETPEASIGITEDLVVQTYKSLNLKITEPIYYGSWCYRQAPKSYQDIIIAEK